MKHNMHEPTVDQSLNRRLNPRQLRKVRLGWLGLALMLILGAVALDHLLPTLPNRGRGFTARPGWYFQHGQLQADLRTLTAMIQYLAADDDATPAATNYANLPGPESPAAGSPDA